MGFLDTVNRNFRPVAVHAPAAEVSPQGQETVETQRSNNEKIESGDVDVDAIDKPVHRDVESGVARVEAVQAVWGKYGFWIVAAG